jgi:hypothetical protein
MKKVGDIIPQIIPTFEKWLEKAELLLMKE